MVRTCTICQLSERQAIDRLIVGKEPYRNIAKRYQLSLSALWRHGAEHLLPMITDGWQRERHENGQELADELRSCMDVIGKLMRACDDFLTDPDDPSRYDLSPRAHEVMVHYDAPSAVSPRPALAEAVVAASRALVAAGGASAERLALLAAVERLDRHDGRGEAAVPVVTPRPVRRKAPLADLLARLDNTELASTVTGWESRTADPRKLIIDAAKALEGHLRLLGEILGKLQTQGTTNFLVSPEWGVLRARMLTALAPYPAAKLALADALAEGQDSPVGDDDYAALGRGGS